MIARLTGKLLDVTEGAVILDVGGVGFLVHVPLGETYRSGESVALYTYLHVRENNLTLYGFSAPDSKALFEMLLGVSGVGPKAALSLLGTLAPETLQRAIMNHQPEVLARAPGVGRKTGEAIVLHLKDRLGKLSGPAVPLTTDDTDVIAALTALGFSLVESQRAIQQLPRDADLSIEDKIRRALALLGS